MTLEINIAQRGKKWIAYFPAYPQMQASGKTADEATQNVENFVKGFLSSYEADLKVQIEKAKAVN